MKNLCPKFGRKHKFINYGDKSFMVPSLVTFDTKIPSTLPELDYMRLEAFLMHKMNTTEC